MKFPWRRKPAPEAANLGSRVPILNKLRAAQLAMPFTVLADQHLDPVVRDAPDYTLPLVMAERFCAELCRVSGTCEIADSVAAARMTLLARLQEIKPAQILLWSADTLGIPALRERLEDEGIRCIEPPEVLSADQESQWHLRVARLEEITRVDMGISGADAAIAATGTLVVRSGRGRNHLTSLMPPRHIALVPWSQLYPTLEFWLSELRQARLAEATWQEVSNVTLITGPSRTGDIESNLLLGAHGPREVHVILFNSRA